jgi:hypothetical protein
LGAAVAALRVGTVPWVSLVVAGLVELLFIQEDLFLLQLLIQSLSVQGVLMQQYYPQLAHLQQEIMVEILFSLIQVLLEQ